MELWKQYKDEKKEYKVNVKTEREKLQQHFTDVDMLLVVGNHFSTPAAYYRVITGKRKMKTHYQLDNTVGLCGRYASRSNITHIVSRVTCKDCIKKLAKQMLKNLQITDVKLL